MSVNYLYIILFFFNFLFIFYFKKISLFLNIFDIPDYKRKIHSKKIACIGGLLIFFNLFFYFSYFFIFQDLNLVSKFTFLSYKEFVFFIIFSSFFLTFGILDDKYVLNSNYKFFIVLLALYLLVYLDNSILIKIINFSFSNNSISIEPFSIFFTILCFLLFINAFNMFDGINLQSSIYSLFFLIIFFIKGVYSELCIVLAIPLIFFLYLNYKNKCFLGNGGSLLLAYIISFMSIKSANSFNIFKADEIFLMMLIPGLDLVRLAFYRILKRRHPFSADKNHIHHILINKYNHIKTLIILIMLIFIPNFFSIFLGYTLEATVVSIIAYLLIIFNLNKFIK